MPGHPLVLGTTPLALGPTPPVRAEPVEAPESQTGRTCSALRPFDSASLRDRPCQRERDDVALFLAFAAVFLRTAFRAAVGRIALFR